MSTHVPKTACVSQQVQDSERKPLCCGEGKGGCLRGVQSPKNGQSRCREIARERRPGEPVPRRLVGTSVQPPPASRAWRLRPRLRPWSVPAPGSPVRPPLWASLLRLDLQSCVRAHRLPASAGTCGYCRCSDREQSGGHLPVRGLPGLVILHPWHEVARCRFRCWKSRVVARGSPSAWRDLIPGPGYWESEAVWRGTSSSVVGSTPGARGLRGGAFTPCWLVTPQGRAVWLVGPRVVAASAPAHCEL